MIGDKFRLRFRKDGDLRLVSHHDLMRCSERMLRRAELPFRVTAGFHPTPRIVFALSLPLGIIGLNEVVEIELRDPHHADDVITRLNQQSPIGLSFHGIRVIPLKMAAVPRRAVYRLPLDSGQLPSPERIAELLDTPKLWVDRIRPRPRRVNIRPYIRGVTCTADAVHFDLWVTQNGTAKADEVARFLGLSELLDAGAVFERTDLELHDETPPDAVDGPPEGPPDLAPLEHGFSPAGTAADDHTTSGTWGLSPNGPVVE